jgi:hypothetical protein
MGGSSEVEEEVTLVQLNYGNGSQNAEGQDRIR